MRAHITLTAADQAVIVAYLLIVLAAGLCFVRRERTSEGYFLAGRTLTLPAFVATLVATWYGGILGIGECAHRYGISTWTILGLPYYVFALIFALWLAPRIRAAELYTIPDKVAEAYGRPAGLVAALLAWLMTNPAAYVLMLGVLLQLTFGMRLVPAMLLGLVLSTVYVYTGGFRADVRVNIAQFVLMFGGFAVVLPFCRATMGGYGMLSRSLPPDHLTLLGGNSIQYVVAWFFIALWTMVDPGFHQRCYAARDPKVARTGVLVSILFWFVFDLMTVTAGLYARVLVPDIDPKMAYPLLADLLLPPFLKGVFFVGMLATVMSTLVSNTFLCGVTFARDFVWRLRGGDENEGVALWTAVGLALSSALAFSLALALPSVVDIWYTVGTCCIPGLLLPLLTAYGRRRPPARWVAATMVASFAVGLLWVLIGHARAADGTPAYPLGLEPMYPGLALSAIVFGIGTLVRRDWPAEAL